MNGTMPHIRKYHGLGNDYIVADPREFPLDPLPANVAAICDRNLGAGSDGILFGPLEDFGTTPWTRRPGSVPRLRIFNPDGSEAEKSGNGLRIFSWYLIERGMAGPGGFRVLTKGGEVGVDIVDAARRILRVDMGKASFSAARIGIADAAFGPDGAFGSDGGGAAATREMVDGVLEAGGERWRITCVTMGNPHCVVMAAHPTPELARRVGPLVERHPFFPARINVQFMEVIDRGTIRIEIWERGAGYTLASGSSSCGAASAAKRLGLVDDTVRVLMPGGELLIEMREHGVFMTGPVEPVFEGRLSRALLDRAGLGGFGDE